LDELLLELLLEFELELLLEFELEFELELLLLLELEFELELELELELWFELELLLELLLRFELELELELLLRFELEFELELDSARIVCRLRLIAFRFATARCCHHRTDFPWILRSTLTTRACAGALAALGAAFR
jgi:hypothetical protein